MRNFLACVLFLTVSLFGQSPYKEVYERTAFFGNYPQKVPVLFRAYPVYLGEGQFRVYFPVEIRRSFFQFLFQENIYTAAAELEIDLTGRKQGVAETCIWQVNTAVKTFQATHDNGTFLRTVDSAEVAAGRYEILLKYRDLNGAQQLTVKQRLHLPKPSPVYASPPLYFYPDLVEDHPLSIQGHPPASLIGHWDFNRDWGILLRIWREEATLPVEVDLKVMEEKEGTTVFSLDTLLHNGQSEETLPVVVPARRLEERRHRLRVLYRWEGDSTRQTVPVQIVWFDKPRSLWNKDLTIKPLQYIMDETAYQALTEGNEAEQLARVREFWKEKDPTPDTPYNELMHEFYSRVDSAIARFSIRGRLGWQTDRGRVYITNGPPDEIEDHSLDPIPNPHLKWIYFRNGHRVVYIFRAIEGRKHYELMNIEETTL